MNHKEEYSKDCCTFKEWLSIYAGSVSAGLIVGLCALAYIIVGETIGAFLFSFALVTILVNGYHLYTGKIGFLHECGYAREPFIWISGNICGVFLAAVISFLVQTPADAASFLMEKFHRSPMQFLFSSFVCGILVYLAVLNYRNSKHILLVIMPVMIFLLCGFEHSIADAFYYFYGISQGLEISGSFYLVGLALFGNAMGSFTMSLLHAVCVNK